MSRRALSFCDCLLCVVVGELEQVDGTVHVGGCSDGHGDPPGVGEDVVRTGAPLGDQRVADAAGKREIREVAPVQVPELSRAEPEFGTPEAVRGCLHAGPGGDGREICSVAWGCVSVILGVGSCGPSDGSYLAAVVVDDLPGDEASFLGC